MVMVTKRKNEESFTKHKKRNNKHTIYTALKPSSLFPGKAGVLPTKT